MILTLLLAPGATPTPTPTLTSSGGGSAWSSYFPAMVTLGIGLLAGGIAWWNVTRQNQRQERQMRAEAYVEFLRLAVQVRTLQSTRMKRERAVNRAKDLVAAKKARDARAAFSEEWNSTHREYIGALQRVKLVAPAHLYECVRLWHAITAQIDEVSAIGQSHPVFEARRQNTLEALVRIARADIKARGSRRWRPTLNREWPELVKRSKVTVSEPEPYEVSPSVELKPLSRWKRRKDSLPDAFHALEAEKETLARVELDFMTPLGMSAPEE